MHYPLPLAGSPREWRYRFHKKFEVRPIAGAVRLMSLTFANNDTSHAFDLYELLNASFWFVAGKLGVCGVAS